jgi:hypothetical protein
MSGIFEAGIHISSIASKIPDIWRKLGVILRGQLSLFAIILQ